MQNSKKAELSTLLSILFIGAFLWFIFRYRRRYSLASYGMFWFFINLAIESTILPLELVFEHRLYLPSIGFMLCAGITLVSLLRAVLSKLNLREFAIVAQCCGIIVLSLLTIASFSRNAVWENSITLYSDAVNKAPQTPRARANLAVALLHAGQYEHALIEAEKAIELTNGRKEEYAVAAQVVVSSKIQMGQNQAAIERGEELVQGFPKSSDPGALPLLHLNIALAYINTEHFERAFYHTLKGLDVVYFLQRQQDQYLTRQKIVHVLDNILRASSDKKLDFDGDGRPDPGDLSPEAWIAKELLARGDRNFATELLKAGLAETPDQPEAQQILEAIQKEENLNNIQKNKWDFSKRYVQHPFSPFNFFMATAFLIREKELPSPFESIGEVLLDQALKLQPYSADAHLLKGWYYYAKDEIENAQREAKLAINFDPNYAKAWLGLGFFAAKANQSANAIAAFEKTLELYPGYSKNQVVLQIIQELREKIS